MAGDWIKMRSNLWDDPRVARLVDLTDSGEACVVGALYWLWATADQHSEDGILHGLTLRAIDRKTGLQGFGAALIEIGWLADHPEGVRIVRFDEHNGSSAKRRSTDAQRKAAVRSLSATEADTVQTDCGLTVELEKEKEKKEKTSANAGAFAEFWAIYPKRRNRGEAEKAWAKLKPTPALQAQILQAVEVAKARDDWRKDGGQFVPYPASWLNAKGWMDDASEGGEYVNGVPQASQPEWMRNAL